MSQLPSVILSAFADEAAASKSVVEQFNALAAIGLQYYSVRFVDLGHGVKNVMKLTKTEVSELRHLQSAFGMNVATLGSPIGKVKLRNTNDGTKNQFVPFQKYLGKEVRRACELAHALETKLIRGFSFYHPRGSDPHEHLSQAADQLGQIAEVCHREDLTFGLEVEANLVGQNGQLMAELHRQVNHPAMVTIFDGGNLVSQGFPPEDVYAQYQAMKPSLGWMHIKDYRLPADQRPGEPIEEGALKHFVPADAGDTGHERILRDFAEVIPRLERKLSRRGIPGVVLDLEPHVKGGGQFGGFSGPDGMGVALRSLLRVLDYVGIDYHLRDFADVCDERGF